MSTHSFFPTNPKFSAFECTPTINRIRHRMRAAADKRFVINLEGKPKCKQLICLLFHQNQILRKAIGCFICSSIRSDGRCYREKATKWINSEAKRESVVDRRDLHPFRSKCHWKFHREWMPRAHRRLFSIIRCSMTFYDIVISIFRDADENTAKLFHLIILWRFRNNPNQIHIIIYSGVCFIN